MTRKLTPHRPHMPSYPTLAEPARFAALAVGLALAMGTGCTPTAEAQDPPEEMMPMPGAQMDHPTVNQAFPGQDRGSINVYLGDGSYAGVTLTLVTVTDAQMGLVIADPAVLQATIVEALAEEDCDTLSSPITAGRLLAAINAALGSELLYHVQVEVSFCELHGGDDGEPPMPDFD